MNMRWAWIFPVLSSLAVTLVPVASQAQGGGKSSAANSKSARQPARPAPQADAAPAGEAPAQAFAVQQAYGQAGMIPVIAPPAGMIPSGVQPVGYITAPMPGMVAGMAPETAPGGFPMSAMAPGMIPTPNAFGSYGALPTDYTSEEAGGGYMGGPGMGMEGGACPYCGGEGCDACWNDNCFDPTGGLLGRIHHRHGLLWDLVTCICPYPDGGCAAIRWFDVSLDFMSLKRDNVGRNTNVASAGIAGPIVLGTSDLDFNAEESFRFTGAFQIGPGSNLEFTYYGLFEYDDTITVTDAGSNLFSVFSQFGILPPGGFPETDASDFQRIDYHSTFDSFEGNFRQRWMSPNCRYQGSWLCGVRHFILDEKFRYLTSSSANPTPLDPFLLTPSQLNLDLDVTNNLTGAQVGGDVWICLLPGLRLGAEAKAGIYGNHVNVNTFITVNTGAQFPPEQQTTDDIAVLGDANITLLYKFNYQWTGRLAYNFLYVDGVALATENFNTVPPFGPTTRVPFINDNGDVFFHGWSAGLEYMW